MLGFLYERLILMPAEGLWRFLHDNEHELIAGFTIVLAVSTILLWWSTRRLWRVTKEIAERQSSDTRILERAYLSIEPRGIEPSSPDRSDRVGARIAIRNVGHLPARNISWSVSIGYPGDGNFVIAAPREPRKAVLSPGAEMVLRSDDVVFTNRLTNSTFVWGMVTYEDGFGCPRFTKFRHAYGTKQFINQEAFSIPGKDAHYCEDGNDAD